MNKEKIIYNLSPENIKIEISNVLNNAKEFIKELFINNELSYIEKIQLLTDHIYYIKYYYSTIGILRTLDDNQTLLESDNLIENYLKEFYLNKDLHRILKNIKRSIPTDQKIIDNKNIIIIKNLIEICQNHENLKVLELTSQNDKIKNKIYELNRTNYNSIDVVNEIKKIFINADKNMTEAPFNLSKPIVLNRNNYYYLQKKVKNPEIRTYIEKQYFKNNFELLNLLSKIIVNRHNISLLHNTKSKTYNTYFEYKQKDNAENSKDIKNLIINLMENINNKCITEISIIKTEMKNDKIDKKNIDQHDIIFYYEKLKNHTKFTPMIALNLLEYILKKFFNIEMKKIENHQLWDNSIITYKLSYDSKILGYVYFDIIARPNKNNTVPIFLSMTNMYVPTKKMTKLSFLDKTQYSVILASFQDMKKECMSINDIISLFKEFGHVLQQITNNIFYDNIELKNLFPQIMEYLIYNEIILDKLCFGKENKTNMVKHFIFMKKINFCISLKIRGINAMFDHTIHNSIELIDWIKQNQGIEGEGLFNIYSTIYAEMMKDIPEINTQLNGINNSIIFQELNDNAGKLYENILIEILAYGIYNTVINGNGNDLINLLLNNKINLKKNIDLFLKEKKIDAYSLFIEEFC
jgi:Zn-dependent oligopeptidase